MPNDWTGVPRRCRWCWCRKGMLMFVVVVPLALSHLGIAGSPGRGESMLNPHSDFIFTATGTHSCRDCHAIGRNEGQRLRVLDNAAVRGLIAKGKGNHGPGRFADCFRCHSGGHLRDERYGQE